MSATSSRRIKQRQWQQGVQSDSLFWKMCSWSLCMCVTVSVFWERTHTKVTHQCVPRWRSLKSLLQNSSLANQAALPACVCVWAWMCHHISANTHHLLNHNRPPLYFFHHVFLTRYTSHHSKLPLTHTSSFFHFHFLFMCFHSLGSKILHCVILESTVLVHLFHSICFSPLSVWKKSTLLLLSSKTNAKVNQFSSTLTPIIEPCCLWTTNCIERGQFVLSNDV